MTESAPYSLSSVDLADACVRLFGSGVSISPLATDDRMGRRIRGVDLSRPLSPAQSDLLIALLDRFSIITFPEQAPSSFEVRHLERLANHFGAPIPHPKNFANYVEHMRSKVPLELLPVDRQAATLCNEAFPGEIRCVEGADSPAVYIVTNLPGSGRGKSERLASGLHWHTDIEFEPIPLSTSMFYVQAVPSTRDADGGTWVPDVPPAEGFYHPESNADLMARRLSLPLNGALPMPILRQRSPTFRASGNGRSSRSWFAGDSARKIPVGSYRWSIPTRGRAGGPCTVRYGLPGART